jgi:hypothetical protein
LLSLIHISPNGTQLLSGPFFSKSCSFVLQYAYCGFFSIYVLPYYFGNLDLNSLVLDGWSAEYNEWAFKYVQHVIVAVENPSAQQIEFLHKNSAHSAMLHLTFLTSKLRTLAFAAHTK